MDAKQLREPATEQVHQRFATVADLYEHAAIKGRQAIFDCAAATVEAQRLFKMADEALRRAGGNMSAFLRDVAD